MNVKRFQLVIYEQQKFGELNIKVWKKLYDISRAYELYRFSTSFVKLLHFSQDHMIFYYDWTVQITCYLIEHFVQYPTHVKNYS